MTASRPRDRSSPQALATSCGAPPWSHSQRGGVASLLLGTVIACRAVDADDHLARAAGGALSLEGPGQGG